METSVFVISDLHLGGGDGFQMCPPAGQATLASFIRYVAEAQSPARRVHLVVGGDIVDFLAEADDEGQYRAFTEDEDAALAKLEAVFARTAVVWDAFAQLVRSGAALTLLLGNHDVELCLPRVRRGLRARLGPGAVEFIYDNEAFRLGRLLVEHGNRYDPWNAIAHDQLRQLRSHLSRGEPAPKYPAAPGSELVVKVMNQLKPRYPFIDLLKPETEALLPVLAALRAPNWRHVAAGLAPAVRQAVRALGYDREGRPRDRDLVSADEVATDLDSEARMIAIASELDDGDDDRDLVSADVSTDERPPDVRRLLRALRVRSREEARTFDPSIESETYLRPARALAERGCAVVVFGHTHLAKRIALDAGALYLNSGTWADLMRLPEALTSSPDAEAEALLGRYLEALQAGSLDLLRRQVATYARIDLDPTDAITRADVFFFDAAGPGEALSAAGLTRRLGVAIA